MHTLCNIYYCTNNVRCMHELKVIYVKKKLSINGNSWVLYVNKSIAEAMGLSLENRNIELYFKDKVLYINLKTDDNKLLVKKMIKRGAGYGLVLSLPFLALLDIEPNRDFVLMDLNNKTLTVRKCL